MPFRIELVRDVYPMDRAFQEMLDRCKTPFFVQVDADMMLAPHAVRRLMEGAERSPETTGIVAGWLWGDAEMMPILGVKAYRHDVCKRYPYQSSPSCEMDQLSRMQADGAGLVVLPEWEVLGLHYSLQSDELAFGRWKRLAWKHRRSPALNWIGSRIKMIEDRALTNPMNKAVLAGYAAGMAGPVPVVEDDRGRRDDDYMRLYGTLRGPTEIALHVTAKCNKACSFCLRQSGPPTHQDMPLEMVADILERFPDARGYCIAGFGEPLMHPEIEGVVERVKSGKRYVNVISNGVLWRRLRDMATKPDMVAISYHTPDDPVADEAVDGLRGRGMDLSAYLVLNADTVGRVPWFLAKMEALGVDEVGLLNTLPHNGTDGWRPVMQDIRQSCRGAHLVRYWPVVPEGVGGRCNSPFVHMGINGNGEITGCRRCVAPAAKNGGYENLNVWWNVS
jgi:hypothetical protein